MGSSRLASSQRSPPQSASAGLPSCDVRRFVPLLPLSYAACDPTLEFGPLPKWEAHQLTNRRAVCSRQFRIYLRWLGVIESPGLVGMRSPHQWTNLSCWKHLGWSSDDENDSCSNEKKKKKKKKSTCVDTTA